MRRFFIFIGAIAFFALCTCAEALLCGIPVYFLWNWLMPELFHLPELTIWQSIGICLLCEFLFKSSSYKRETKN